MTIFGTDQSVTFAGAVNVASSAFANGSAAAPSITFTGDTNTGIFSPAADTIAFAEGGAEAMRLDSSGNLGIGTASPSSKLEVIGPSSSVGTISWQNQSRKTGYLYSDTAGVAIYATEFDNAGIYLVDNDRIAFFVNGSERMRLDTNDSILNGSGVPSASGNPTTNTISMGGSGWYASMTGANNYWNHSYNGTTYNLRYQGSGVGSIVVNSGSVAFNTTSDYRLKENVQPMTGALTKVAQLKPCTYTWKATGESNEGFIAHELAEVCPQAVTGQKDAVEEDGSIRPQGIDTSFLVATLTAAIQEQQAIITELKARIEILEAK
jgi:hypothetical protein